MFNIRRHKLRIAQADRQIKWLTGVLVAASVIVPTTAVLAQTSDTTTTTTVTTTTMTGPNDTMAWDHINFAILASPKLDYFSIRRARAYGLTDDQIADAFALAHETLHSFPSVLDRIEDGATFPWLAEAWGVPLEDVYSPEKYRGMIRDYMRAYEHTGYGALHNRDWENWPDWVDWQTGAAPLTDTPVVNGTGSSGVISGESGSSSSTTTITTPATTPMSPAISPTPAPSTTPDMSTTAPTTTPDTSDNGTSTTTAPTAPTTNPGAGDTTAPAAPAQ